MAKDPPYRLDPLQNPVNVKWTDEGGGGEAGSHPVDCWFHGAVLLILNAGDPSSPFWATCEVPGTYSDSPSDVVNSCESGAFGGVIDNWYVNEFGNIVAFAWQWAAGVDCGSAPNAEDMENRPTSPPDGWNPNNHSPNSEE